MQPNTWDMDETPWRWDPQSTFYHKNRYGYYGLLFLYYSHALNI